MSEDKSTAPITRTRTVNTLSHLEMARCFQYLDAWRDLILSERWTKARTAEELAKRLGRPVTLDNVESMAKNYKVQFNPVRVQFNPVRSQPSVPVKTVKNERIEALEKKVEELAENAQLAPNMADVAETNDYVTKRVAEMDATLTRFSETGAKALQMVTHTDDKVAALQARIATLENTVEKLLAELGITRLDRAVKAAVSGEKK